MDRIVEIWQSGGWVMVPLFALAVLLYSQAFRLIAYVRDARLEGDSEVNWFDWVRKPESAEGRVGEVIQYTQRDLHSAKQVRSRFDEIRTSLLSTIDDRARFVGVLVAAAPLLGLLGTVLGMLQTFLGISTSGGSETAGVVAEGIAEALVTTQTGLTIALPGLFMVMLIRRQRYKLEAGLARLESLTLSYLRFE